MRYLTIGLISILLGEAISCNKTEDKSMEGQFYFINSTSHRISFSAGFEKFNLAPNSSSTVFTVTDISDQSVGIDDFFTPFLKQPAYKVPAESIVIRFGTNKCVTVRDNTGSHNILNISSYAAEKLAQRKYKFVYTFTEADFASAVACQ